MSQQTSDDGGKSGFETLVRAAREQMQQARSQYYQDKISNGPIRHRTRVNVARAALNYYDVLWEFRDKDQQVKSAWLDSGVDKIQEWSNQDRVVDAPTAGDTSATQKRTQNALLAADPDHIISLTKQLDYFANELGFGADVDAGRPLGRIGGEERYGGDDDDE